MTHAHWFGLGMVVAYVAVIVLVTVKSAKAKGPKKDVDEENHL